MQEIGNKIINSPDTIIDESFSHKDRREFDLFIFINDEQLELTAWSSGDHVLYALERYSLQGLQNLSDTSVFQDILNQSKLAKNANEYHSRFVFSGLRNVTMIPNALFMADELDLQHSFSAPTSDNSRVFTDELRIADARSIYSLPKELDMNLRNLFGHFDLFHASTALIESQLLSNRNKNEHTFCVIIYDSYFELLVVNGRQLLLYNTFDIENSESLLYYCLFCCEQLGLNPESVHVELAGAIDSASQSYSNLERYFRNISFGDKESDTKISYRFQESPSHRFYPALNFPACV